MKGLVIGFKESDLVEGLAALETLSKNLGDPLEAYAILISEAQYIVNGYSHIYHIKGRSIYGLFTYIHGFVKDLAPDTVVSVNTKDGVDLVGRLSVSGNKPMITEVSIITKQGGDTLLGRLILGGRALAYYTYRPGIFFTVASGKFMEISLETVPKITEYEPEVGEYNVVGVEAKKRGAVDIESAEVVVGVGRGFRNKDDLAMAEELAKLLGGEVGCSRPIAADFGWLDEDRWIGISGKKIRPKLYIPIGISGAPQHIMAANDAKIIIAVNKDKNAPIFNYSDYGVVADLYQFLPIFIKILKERLGK